MVASPNSGAAPEGSRSTVADKRDAPPDCSVVLPSAADAADGDAPPDGDANPRRRVFVDGVFDMTHSGHFNAMRQARSLGSRLVVGVNSDADVSASKGVLPVYSQEERAEIAAECRWVDEVVIGTPYAVSVALLDDLKCDIVGHGDDVPTCTDGSDCYAGPRSVDGLLVGAPRSLSDEQARRMGVTHVVTHNEVDNIRLEEETQSEAAKQSWRRCNLEAATTLTTAEILRRIAHRRSLLAATIDSRVMKENSYYEERLTNMKND
eukprot:Selendium_serpulae@DN5964_c1_g1_i13.p1